MTRPIIVPLDGSELAAAALPRAAVLARLLKEPIHIVRVHVPVLGLTVAESPVAIPGQAWDTSLREAAEKWLAETAATAAADLKVKVTSELRIGVPADEVVAAAKAIDAHAIVCTTHGHGGWAAQWIGSVADAIIRHSPCPVLAISENAIIEPIALAHILVPHDGSDTAAAIIPAVRELALPAKATVDLYRVVAPPWVGDALTAVQSGSVDSFGVDQAADVAKTELDRVAEDLRYAGVHTTTCVEVATNPIRAIIDRIGETKPDLVAMSTHGRGLSRLFMGSVADKVLRAGGRPVFCWKPPREVSKDPDAQRMFATSVSGPAA